MYNMKIECSYFLRVKVHLVCSIGILISVPVLTIHAELNLVGVGPLWVVLSAFGFDFPYCHESVKLYLYSNLDLF